MKKLYLFIAALSMLLAPVFKIQAQVAVSTDGLPPHASAMLDVRSNSKGLLLPRLTTAQRTTLGATAIGGLMVYDTDLNRYYYHNGTGWEVASMGGLWSISGTSGIYATDLTDLVGIGTSDPSRKFEVTGPWQLARLTTTSSGPTLEFNGSASPDWAIGSWGGLFLFSSSADNFSSMIDEYALSTTAFTPYAGAAKNLGSTSYRWSTLYSTDGRFSGNVSIGVTAPRTVLDVHGAWPQMRLSSTASGSFLQFAGTATTDWGVGSWANDFRITSTANDFTNITDEFVFTTSEFRPFTTNTKTLGNNVYRWSTIFGINGTFSGTLGVGTTNPMTNFEVVGPLRTARLTSTTQGAMLQFASTSNPEWGIGTWGSSLRMSSTTDDFVGLSDEYSFSTTEFTPWANNTKLLGSTTKRWSAVHSVDGTFSGNVDVQGNVIAQSNAVVGSTSVLGKLHVHDGATHRAAMYITPMTTSSGDSAMIFLAEDDAGDFGMYWLYDGTGNDMQLYGKSGTTIYGPHFQVDRTTGNVAIGSTFANGYRLSVEGKVICTELRVNLVTSWPDYVFRPGYNLMPVEELGTFVRTNGHLPNVPPASEIESSGMDVGQMQRVMMEKIEELSLYIIQQQEQIKELRDQLNNKNN